MKVLHLLASGGTGGIEILCKNIAFNSTSNIDNRWVVLFNEGETFTEMKEKGINIFSVSKLSFFKKITKLSNYCKDEKIDIIVNHHGGLNCNILYCLLKLKNPKIKYIRYMHACFDGHAFGCGENKIKDFFIKCIMQKAINYSDCLIYISNAVKKTFNQNFKVKIKEYVIYNGIGKEFFGTLENKKPKKDKINLIYVGRLVKSKGVNILIDAFSKIVNESNGYKYFLTIVGDGIEREKLEKQVKRLNLSELVKFVGNQKDVITWLDKSDIFVYPSIWEEGFGISVVEAMARGCVPITFNKGGLPEIIENLYNGILIDTVSDTNLAKAIEELNITEELKANVIKTANNFSIQKFIKKLENVYDEILL